MRWGKGSIQSEVMFCEKKEIIAQQVLYFPLTAADYFRRNNSSDIFTVTFVCTVGKCFDSRNKTVSSQHTVTLIKGIFEQKEKTNIRNNHCLKTQSPHTAKKETGKMAL